MRVHTNSCTSSLAKEKTRPNTSMSTLKTAEVEPDLHRRAVEWGLEDFIGKYHLNRMNTHNPVPGTAIRVEQERNEFVAKRATALNKVLGEIESRRTLRATSRSRKSAITARVEVQATVGYKIDTAQRMYNSARSTKKQRVSTSRYLADEDFRTFLGQVETNNIYQVRSRLRRDKASRLIATAEERYGNTPLHRAVSLGYVEMSRIILEAGANVDEVNNMGDAPVHCCWRFWAGDTYKYFSWKRDPYLMTTSRQRDDFATMGKNVKTTVELLSLLARFGADIDLQKNNGEVALHTAARRGPVQAVWVLLFSKATHDVIDHRHFTPEGAAARAGNNDVVALLANWPIAKLKYLDSEFVQQWMHFLCDPDANLGHNLTASEVMAQVRMEEHEESTAVRARGGHTLIDETVTGPVLSAEDRAQARLADFSADAVSLTSSLDSGTSAGRVRGALEGGTGTTKQRHPPTAQPQQTHLHRVDEQDGLNGDKKEDQNENHRPTTRKTKSKLGKEIDVFLAQARDENGAATPANVVGGASDVTAYSRLVAKANLDGRKSRWPGRRNNGSKKASAGGGGDGRAAADPFGRPMTTSQRRRVAALEIAEDGGVEGPQLRPATSSVLLTTRERAVKKASAPHPYYGRRLLTQRVLDQREREASIKPTATIYVDGDLNVVAAGGGVGTAGAQHRELYLTETRMAFNDKKLLPRPNDPSMCVEGLGRLHPLHPVMQRRRLHERPLCELQGHRKHNENVYCSTLENYRPAAWCSTATQEPLLPVRRRGP